MFFSISGWRTGERATADRKKTARGEGKGARRERPRFVERINAKCAQSKAYYRIEWPEYGEETKAALRAAIRPTPKIDAYVRTFGMARRVVRTV